MNEWTSGWTSDVSTHNGQVSRVTILNGIFWHFSDHELASPELWLRIVGSSWMTTEQKIVKIQGRVLNVLKKKMQRKLA